jgi:uncharacterized membrane protein
MLFSRIAQFPYRSFCWNFRMRKRLWLLVAILLVACWLGARGLDYDTIWTDEFYSLSDVGLLDRMTGERIETPSTAAEIWNRVAEGNQWHAPLFFILLSGWERVIGPDPAALRMLALFFGLLTIAWTYRLARDLFIPRIGVYAALLMGVSSYLIYYFHEIRVYTLVAFFSAYVFWAYFRIISGKPVATYHWLGLLAGATLFLYTHYFAGLVIAGIGIYHLLWGARRFGPTRFLQSRAWWQAVGLLALSVVLFIPWLRVFIEGFLLTSASENRRSLVLSNAAVGELLLNLFSNGQILLLIALIFIAARNIRKQSFQYILVLLVSICTILLLVNLVLELFQPSRIRYMILLWPLVTLFVALGVDQFRRWRFVPQAILLVWMANNLFGTFVPAYFAQLDASTYIYPIQEVAHYVRVHQQAEDEVLSYVPDGLRMARYDRLANYYFADFVVSHRNVGQIYQSDSLMDALHEEVMQYLDGTERVWLAYMPDKPSETMDEFLDKFEDEYALCSTIEDENQVNIALYSLSPVCCIPDAASPEPTLQFGDWFTVAGSEITRSLDGEALDIVISWNVAATAPLHAYSATVQLFDMTGQPVGQADYGIHPSTYTCQRATINVDDLQPGPYEARIAVYNWQTGERLAARNLVTGASGDMLAVATITIE